MEKEIQKLILTLKKVAEKKSYYSNYARAREWIDELIQLDLLGKPLPATKYILVDKDAQAIDIILREWLRAFTDKPIDKEKRDFIVKVFKKKREMIIQDDWIPYIQVLCQYFRASSKTDLKANMSLFCLGWAWIFASCEEERGE